jgi:hypothetical protein
MTFFRTDLRMGVLLLLGVATAQAAPDIPAVDTFEPIVTFAIFPSQKPGGTADEALATGRVRPSYFPMAKGPTSPGASRSCFPISKTLTGSVVTTAS